MTRPFITTLFFVSVSLCLWTHYSNAQGSQCNPAMRAAAENLNFVQGAPDSSPPGWHLGYLPSHIPVEALTAARAVCNGSQQCATVRSLRDDPAERKGFLFQVIDASQYRGKKLTFRAAVRAAVTGGGAARLLVRVHRNDCSTSFFDDMGNHPIITATWAFYEIQAPIASDARDFEFGLQLIGQGTAWIDNLSLDFTEVSK